MGQRDRREAPELPEEDGMDRHYAPLGAQLMRAGTIVRQPALESTPRVAPEDPAVSVMTDLS